MGERASKMKFEDTRSPLRNSYSENNPEGEQSHLRRGLHGVQGETAQEPEIWTTGRHDSADLSRSNQRLIDYWPANIIFSTTTVLFG